MLCFPRVASADADFQINPFTGEFDLTVDGADSFTVGTCMYFGDTSTSICRSGNKIIVTVNTQVIHIFEEALVNVVYSGMNVIYSGEQVVY